MASKGPITGNPNQQSVQTAYAVGEEELESVLVSYSAPVALEVSVQMVYKESSSSAAILSTITFINHLSGSYIPEGTIHLEDGEGIEVTAPAGGAKVTCTTTIRMKPCDGVTT